MPKHNSTYSRRRRSNRSSRHLRKRSSRRKRSSTRKRCSKGSRKRCRKSKTNRLSKGNHYGKRCPNKSKKICKKNKKQQLGGGRKDAMVQQINLFKNRLERLEKQLNMPVKYQGFSEIKSNLDKAEQLIQQIDFESNNTNDYFNDSYFKAMNRAQDYLLGADMCWYYISGNELK